MLERSIESGGFDPTLSLFDSAGTLVAVNRDGGCANVAADGATSFCWDSYLSVNLPAGSYRVVLTESENLPNGPTLADSFAYDGSGNFTADPEGPLNPAFWDFSPMRRTGKWAVDLQGVDSVPAAAIPEMLVNGASFAGGQAAPNTVLTLFSPQVGLGGAVAVTVDGVAADILYVNPTQVNFAVPSEVSMKNGAVVGLWRGKSMVLSMPLDIVPTSPAIFTTTESGTGQASVNRWPAARGSTVEVYVTGLGQGGEPDADGLSRVTAPVMATVGGMPAMVEFAGFPPGWSKGLQQVNVVIPRDCPTGPAVPIRLHAGGRSTQAGVTIAVED